MPIELPANRCSLASHSPAGSTPERITSMEDVSPIGPSKTCFHFQLDLLKEEIRSIERVIDRMDGITQATKNWALSHGLPG